MLLVLRCISVGDMLGMMEIVPNSETIADIHIASVSKSLSGAKRKAAAASMVGPSCFARPTVPLACVTLTASWPCVQVWKPETLSKWLKVSVLPPSPAPPRALVPDSLATSVASFVAGANRTAHRRWGEVADQEPAA